MTDRSAGVLPRFDPPLDWPLAAPFWEAVEAGRLVLPRCSACGRWQWYPDEAGADCPDAELVWVPVAATGVVYSLTRVHRSFLPRGRDDGHYVVGLVDLDGLDQADGPRLVANLADLQGMGIGARVRLRAEPLGDRRHPVFHLDNDNGGAVTRGGGP